MKKLFLSFLFVIVCQFAVGTDFRTVDSMSAKVPKNLNTIEEISFSLSHTLVSPTDKIRSFYYWISHNIVYNIKLYDSNKTIQSIDLLNVETLNSRQGVCKNYAELFHAFCQNSGIESYVIDGYTITDHKIAKISHAWNAVKINGRYSLLDITWASGYELNGKYVHTFADQFFMISPAEFIKTHIPYDPIWQFLSNPLLHKEVQSNNLSKLKNEGNYNYQDSIKVQSKLNPLDKLIRENKRISQAGVTNNLIREKIAFNQLNILNLKHNKAVEMYNASVQLFNTYIVAKNNQFSKLKLPDNEIVELITQAKNQLDAAEKEIAPLNSNSGDLNKQIRDLDNAIKTIRMEQEKEDEFVQKYLKTKRPFRILLFTR